MPSHQELQDEYNATQTTAVATFIPSYTSPTKKPKLTNGKSLNSKSGDSNTKSVCKDDIVGGSFDKTQLTKLLIHSLKELGYDNSALTLQEESGAIQVESSVVQKLFNFIRNGDFINISLDLLTKLPLRTGHLDLSRIHYTFPLSSNSLSNRNDSTASSSNGRDSMRIETMISSDGDDFRRLSSHMASQVSILEDILEVVAKKLHSNSVLLFLEQFKEIIEIFVLINMEIFLELVFTNGNAIDSVTYLRNIFRKFIQIWDSVLLLQNEFAEPDPKFNPDSLLREMSSLLTNPYSNNSNNHYNGNNITNGNENNSSNNNGNVNMGYSIWKGSSISTREYIMELISNYINPNDLVPKGRLITLLKQAIEYQKSQDMFNVIDMDMDPTNRGENDTRPHVFNLLQDNSTNLGNIKFSEEYILTQNTEEIWYLQFSPDGKYLASAAADSGTDRKIFIYDVENDFQVYKELGGNKQCILYLSFSPDSKYLVSCPFNEAANIYDIHSKGTPTNINEKIPPTTHNGKPIIAEIISPIDSFHIPNSLASNVHTSAVSPPTSDGEGSSSPSSSGNIATSTLSRITRRDRTHSSSYASTTYGRNGINITGLTSSPRIWCCDWFHTKEHYGKFAVGSPDRDVVIYDIFSKKIIYKMASSISFANNDVLENMIGNDADQSRMASRSNDSGRGGSNSSNNNNNNNANINTHSNMESSTFTFMDQFPRIHDLKISRDDKCLILMTHQGIIEVYDISKFPNNDIINQLLEERSNSFNVNDNESKSNAIEGVDMDPILHDLIFTKISQLNINKNMTCISLPDIECFPTGDEDYDMDSKDEEENAYSLNSLLLVSLQYNEMQLWDYKENLLIQKFIGQKQEQFIIRSCFGYNNKLVASGSEDGKVYIWDRIKGNIISVLNAHNAQTIRDSKRLGMNCNVVVWNPKCKSMFASGGDDGLIVIWNVNRE
ncbi:glucose-induced degradation complex subunit GID7 NDAI_0A00340 [Naumovozyma dairenensis CBS 421]|uniref:Uncharacterized protein n=1 Tax=Naumovozyma dairenensis (strain ATCC 10597 / BCRC 20456 / CBS 421 / NBRC 0211 / NRRL Y-12639) TaxID=1071378 RepID=G0W5I0_NAUDC|nr:hypothetical protein NDAI_0A00340 [Naumovozyma dairenensis CBS 421]CCD22194.1 hypothetical protein NDAI_0A00340 [Naumovozyma dairenensis CBS 421]